jgi:uncharacterized damage-inducible protein DinB
MRTIIKSLLIKNLSQLKVEVESYTKNSDLWITSGKITNSGGNLTLHLIGNLNHFIGATLGNTGYIRHRENEFNQKDIPIEDLVVSINKTIEMVALTLDQLDEEKLEKDYPIDVFGEKIKTGDFLFYLTTHLSYHLGQINYHRRNHK